MLIETWQLPSGVITARDHRIAPHHMYPVGWMIDGPEPYAWAHRQTPPSDRSRVHLPCQDEVVVDLWWRIGDCPEAIPGELAIAIDVGEVAKDSVRFPPFGVTEPALLHR